jgi:hypothetical protein
MRIQDADTSSDSGRTSIDRHAVTAAGELLMSAIWMEHRVRRFSTRFSILPSPRGSTVTAVRSSDGRHQDRGVLVPDGRGD